MKDVVSFQLLRSHPQPTPKKALSWKPRRCVSCGEGVVSLRAVEGRLASYKGVPNVPIPAEVEIPTCDRCGAEWLNEEVARRLDEALEAVSQKETPPNTPR
jgi:NMD protein affecting ribosome stability and mRNA decay